MTCSQCLKKELSTKNSTPVKLFFKIKEEVRHFHIFFKAELADLSTDEEINKPVLSTQRHTHRNIIQH